MKKIVFGGICMLISVIGLFTKAWGLYVVFFLVGIIGFILGIWGVFEKK